MQMPGVATILQYTQRIVRARGCLAVVAQWLEHYQLKPPESSSVVFYILLSTVKPASFPGKMI